MLVVVAASGVLGAAGTVFTRYAPGTVEVELNSQIHRKRRTARQLEVLTSSGWTVLHDRLAPGGEHRLAHVLAGPAGVVVATEIPAHGPLTVRGTNLFAGGVALGDWLRTRWWEVTVVNRALVDTVPGFVGPVYPLAVVPLTETRGPLRRWLGPNLDTRTEVWNYPTGHAEVTIRTIAHARPWITSLVAPLGRLASAELAAQLEQLCPPAATQGLTTP